MPDEEIDKIVREAANQHHPAYDDTAWGKMEVLLDKHLPQKKDRKRPILFLLLFLLVGSGVFFALDNRSKKQSPSTPDNTTVNQPVNTNQGSSENLPANPGDDATAGMGLSQQPSDLTANTGKTASDINTTTALINSKQYGAANDQADPFGKRTNLAQKSRTAMKVKRPGATTDEDNNNTASTKTPADKNIAGNEDMTISTINVTGIADEPAEKKEQPKEETVKVAEEKKVTEEKPSEKSNTAKASKTSNKKRFADKLGITVSGGTDISFIKLENAGKVKPAYGAGLNYELGKQLTVASGFYVSKKIYSAAPYDYKFPNGMVYPNLVNIEADCDVYEIPVSVYYNFKGKKNHNWLVGASLSSFLMKKEKYDYQYKTPSGNTYSYVSTINNKNKHYFSVVTISGGYKYKINDRFAFVAEPYLKVPLAGVGAGKIKLNSAGVLVTAVVKPFAKAKK